MAAYNNSEQSDANEEIKKTKTLEKSPIEEVIEETVIEGYSPELEAVKQSPQKISPKTKKSKRKLQKQASHSDSRSSGEISSSGSTTDESGESTKIPEKPKRRQSPRMLREMEERRIALQRMDSHGRPGYWNTDSSSDCHSSPAPGRPRINYYDRRSPPPFDRFGERLPPPRPHFRDDRYPPRHSIPHRMRAPFDRPPLEFPGPNMAFGSPPHSPPMKRFSPPRRLGERYSGDMHHPMHRFTPPVRQRLSPPHPSQMHPRHRMR